ncbi:hypothetical protein EV360DRAFT_85880 [Lentinula raphanica]|nr:hypothetical protein EV360DRAFT_85880 [Lentinula raphanica]
MNSKKSKAKGISSGSLFDLKADLAKQGEAFARAKAEGKTYSLGNERPEKKPSVWARPNKGVHGRAAKDVREAEIVGQPTLQKIRSSLEAKAQIYDKLKRGKTGGLSEKQIEALPVDFVPPDNWESDSDDVDESLSVPTINNENDPFVEYVDEFGRTRTARKSEVPRQAKLDEEVGDDEDEGVIRNPQVLQNHFPTFQPDEERRTQIEKEYSEENRPLETHYDPNSEIRDRGAASYTFSGDAKTRQAIMEELKMSHVETEYIRKEMGAVDVRPGEVEGMQASEIGSSARGTEKRKREMAKRQEALLDARRKKAKTTVNASQPGPDATPPTVKSANLKQSPVTKSVDPFAALESATSSPLARKHDKGKTDLPEADEFLAQLGNDMLNQMRK